MIALSAFTKIHSAGFLSAKFFYLRSIYPFVMQLIPVLEGKASYPGSRTYFRHVNLHCGNHSVFRKNPAIRFQLLRTCCNTLENRVKEGRKCFNVLRKCFKGVRKCFNVLRKCFKGVGNCFNALRKCFNGVSNCFNGVSNCFNALRKCFKNVENRPKCMS